jgi:hypothetical protein
VADFFFLILDSHCHCIKVFDSHCHCQEQMTKFSANRQIVQMGSSSTDETCNIDLARNKARMGCPRCSNVFCVVCIEDWSNCACSRAIEDTSRMLSRAQNSDPLPLLPLFSPFSRIRSGQHPKNGRCKIVENNNFRDCKRCGIKIEKESGCDKIKCRCGFRFCYHCGAENAQCNCTPLEHGFWDNYTNAGDFSNLDKKKSPT